MALPADERQAVSPGFARAEVAMRKALCASLTALASNPRFVFLTGDLGFMALEELRDAIGRRFINAGVAEQNMISMCAGLARGGWRPWAYSIAPFIYARPLEQVRVDICLHGFPVVLVGNGGGYGYGVQGGTHHALEDYGILTSLQGMTAYIPAFDDDVARIVPLLMQEAVGPTYLRLGVSELPNGATAPAYAPWRKLLAGTVPATVIAIGPLAGGYLKAFQQLDRSPRLWVLSQLPADDWPSELIHDILQSRHLLVAEEHVAIGGAGQAIAYGLTTRGLSVSRFTHRFAAGYPSGTYGSQAFHRRESGLAPDDIIAALREEILL